ncbi:MAG: bifunctional phosphopantothenoylcysteine decarboxylase/phosphopantothenate--cysteine ligase CoaBC [Desulfotalea sp.]
MDSFLAGKKIVVGLCGSIAAFKVAGWVSTMSKAEADLDVVMTGGAKKFITPLSLAALSGKKVYEDMFDETNSIMSHIDIGQNADVLIVAPASANFIARAAAGMADDLLSTILLASTCKVVICPAMNPNMYKHPATIRNIKILQEYGYIVLEPSVGHVACKQEGQGRLIEWEFVRECLAHILVKQDYAGKKLLVSAGPTIETIDPARFISNRSSGKMGYAVARAATRRGAEVCLVTGPSSQEIPIVSKLVQITSAIEMNEAMVENFPISEIIIKSAAVSDFRPKESFENKVKKVDADLSINLVQNPDILKGLGQKKREGQLLVGFAAESKDIISEGRKKLVSKHLDMIAVNDISAENTGFASDTNKLHLISSKEQKTLPLTSKFHTANLLLDEILKLQG